MNNVLEELIKLRDNAYNGKYLLSGYPNVEGIIYKREKVATCSEEMADYLTHLNNHLDYLVALKSENIRLQNELRDAKEDNKKLIEKNNYLMTHLRKLTEKIKLSTKY